MASFDDKYLLRRGTSGFHPGEDPNIISGSPSETIPKNIEFKLNQLKINYESKGKEKKTFVIGVCGGSASGKTTVCKKIIEMLNNKKVVVLSQDSFYKSLTDEQKELAHRAEYDFDHPGKFI